MGYDRKDGAYRAAKEAGYRSRAAMKLLEIDRKRRLFRRGARVVELGCWPGGWLQVAAERVGGSGRVVGVDLKETEALPQSFVTTVVGDVFEPSTLENLIEMLGGPADVVLSDLAPKLSGIREADAARHHALIEAAATSAVALLGPSGCFVTKLFTRGEAEARAVLKANFAEVSTFRPTTTRKGSSEIYAIAGKPRTA